MRNDALMHREGAKGCFSLYRRLVNQLLILMCNKLGLPGQYWEHQLIYCLYIITSNLDKVMLKCFYLLYFVLSNSF